MKEPTSGLATQRPSRSIRILTTAGAASVYRMPNVSFRPSPFGENAAGATATSPSVRLTLSGMSFCTETPAAVRAVMTTL